MQKTILKADWSNYEKRPTWSFVSTPELAKILGKSLQSVNNYILREKLPKPDRKPCARGNKNWFKISSIRSFLEGRPEDVIHWEWIHNNLKEDKFQTIGQAQFLVQNCYSILGVEKP